MKNYMHIIGVSIFLLGTISFADTFYGSAENYQHKTYNITASPGSHRFVSRVDYGLAAQWVKVRWVVNGQTVKTENEPYRTSDLYIDINETITNIICEVYIGSNSVYSLEGSAEWKISLSSIPVQIYVQASPSEGGTGATYVCNVGDNISITAMPNVGWEFAGWSDGALLQTRTVKASLNSSAYIALFEKTEEAPRSYYGSTDSSILLFWPSVPEAISYQIYRISSKDWANDYDFFTQATPDNAKLIAETQYLVYEDSLEEEEVPYDYFYFIVAQFESGDKTGFSQGVFGTTQRRHEARVEEIKIMVNLGVKLVTGSIADIYKVEKIAEDLLKEELMKALEKNKEEPPSSFVGSTYVLEPSYVMTGSPVDIELHSKNSSVVISKTNAHEYGCAYLEGEFIKPGETNDIFVLYRPLLDFYKIKYIPDTGSDGEMFSAIVRSGGRNEIVYKKEIIDTATAYESALTPKPSLSIYTSSNYFDMVWVPMGTNINCIVEESQDLQTWTNCNANIEQTVYCSKCTLSQSNFTDSSFFRIRIENE